MIIVDDLKSKYPVASVCKVLKLSRRTFYLWLKNGKKEYNVKWDKDFAMKVKEIFVEENGLYGAPRIKIVLNKLGIECSSTKVARYMRLQSLYSIVRVKHITNKKPKELKNTKSGFKNIVKRNWSSYGINELWVTDVSYIPLMKTFAYLSVLKDVYSGFIVGFALSLVNDNKIYMDTMADAVKYRSDESKPLIIHSDNGNQYTSIWAQRYAKKHNIIISLSRPGNSIDNAACETFFSQLKFECPKVLHQKSFKDLEAVVKEYINYYNYKRLTIKRESTPSEAFLSK